MLQSEISTLDSISALLLSIGFRPADAISSARLIYQHKKNRTALRTTILGQLESLQGSLKTQVAFAIIQLLETSKATLSTVWDHLVRIWEDTKFNIAVASHRLRVPVLEPPAEVRFEMAPKRGSTPSGKGNRKLVATIQ